MEPARLARLVRGELDWIVMRALEKDRVRRYDTANAFARDIQRYLDGDPVEAGPPSATYRLRKFARKYRPWLLTASAFAVLLVSTTAVSVWQALRATRAEHSAQVDRDRGRSRPRSRLRRSVTVHLKPKRQRTISPRRPRSPKRANADLRVVMSALVGSLKDATVYLKVNVAGKTLVTGTGFVIERSGDTVLLATSREVAIPDRSRIPSRYLPPGSKMEIQAVFRSGQGAQREQTLPAEIVAVDSSDRSSAASGLSRSQRREEDTDAAQCRNRVCD